MRLAARNSIQKLWRRFPRNVHLGLLVATCIVVSYLALMPAPPPPPSHWFGFDKVAHFGCWAALAFLVVPLLPQRAANRRLQRTWSVATGLSVLHGGLVEVIQIPVPGRTGDILDLVADALGAACGAGLAIWLWGAEDVDPAAASSLSSPKS